ncbi:MAG: DoxX family protein [Pseudomonadota bacterium]
MFFIRLHDAFFDLIERATAGWLPGLFARLAFASVLLIYFWHSATRKLVASERGAEGALAEYFTVSGNTFAQIAPKAFETAGYDATQLDTPFWVMAYAGTYGEFILPLLVVIGFATRLASLGMIVFVFVQSWVDITGHQAGAETIGTPFDRIQDSAILDQRLLWLVPLVYLVVRGAGALSVDGVLSRRMGLRGSMG